MEDAMTDTQKDFEAVLKTLGQAESLFADGHPIDDICEQIGIEKDTLQAWAGHLSLPRNYAEVLSSCHILDAVFPIFAAERPSAPLDHIGSGVVIKIGNDLFALTVAHVTDHAEGDGALFMPAAEGIEQMTGVLSFNPVPEHGSLAKDIGDMGYYHLSDDWLTKLHSAIKPLALDDLLLTDELETGDIFTFVGYPWRKTKSRGRFRETDRTTYTGHASAPDIYEKLEYNRFVNVVIRMRRKKTYSTRYESHQIAPHPQGISGGAVIAWPWNLIDRHDASNLKLAAIGHTYHEREHCMAATRIIPYMMAIVRNNPELAIHFTRQEIAEDFGVFLAERMKALNPNNVPSAVGIGWYKPETYAQCLAIFDDRDDLPDSFAEWKQLAENTEQQLAAQGIKTVRAEIDPRTFPTWCSENGFEKIDKHSRMAYGNAKAIETLQQGT